MPPPHAVASSSACIEPPQGVEVQCQAPSPSKRQQTWGISGISYLKGICIGVGGWASLELKCAETEGVEAEGAEAEVNGIEVKILTSKSRR